MFEGEGVGTASIGDSAGEGGDKAGKDTLSGIGKWTVVGGRTRRGTANGESWAGRIAGTSSL